MPATYFLECKLIKPGQIYKILLFKLLFIFIQQQNDFFAFLRIYEP